MSFKRNNEYSENQRFSKDEKKSDNSIFWQMSSSIYETANIVANVSITFILIIILIFKININVTEKVISSLIQIATSFGALSLAIPLFLKDFKVQKTLWISFLTLSILFIFSTILGIFITVFYPANIYNIQFTLVFIIALFISFNLRSLLAIFRLRYKRKNKNRFLVELKPSEIYDFIVILILIIVLSVFSKGIASPFFILFFYSILILITVIISSLITSLTQRTNKDPQFELILKQSIQKALETKPEIAFSEQKIIDELRNNHYSGKSEQVSRTSVIEAVKEMDSEINTSFPVATIFSYELIIPRWNDLFKKKALSVLPELIFFKSNDDYKYDFFCNELLKNDEDNLLSYLAKASELSIELLKDGNVIEQLINRLDVYRKRNSFNGNYLCAYNSNFWLKTQKDHINIQHTKSISELYSLYKRIDNNSYISNVFSDSRGFEVIKDFIEIELYQNLKFTDFIPIKMNEVFELITDSNDGEVEINIISHFDKKFLNHISNESIFFSEIKKIIKEQISLILEELEGADKIEKFRNEKEWRSGYKTYYKVKN